LCRLYDWGSLTWLCGVRLIQRVRVTTVPTQWLLKSVVVSVSVSLTLPLQSSPEPTVQPWDSSATNSVTHSASERSTVLVSGSTMCKTFLKCIKLYTSTSVMRRGGIWAVVNDAKAVITIAIWLRSDYDPNTTYRARLLPFDAIRREQKIACQFFVVVVS